MGRRSSYSLTILTLSPGMQCLPGSSPLSTRKRSSGRSTALMRPASFSTVSPAATVTMCRRRGFAPDLGEAHAAERLDRFAVDAVGVGGIPAFVA